MTKGLLLDCDAQVAAWTFETHNKVPIHVDRALGIVEDGVLVGGILFTSYNTINVDLSYYGKNTVTVGIARALARVMLYELRVSRCTAIVPKRPGFLLKKLPKFGFRFEGVQRRYFGPTDSARHTGCRFVLFKEDLEKIAKEELTEAA